MLRRVIAGLFVVGLAFGVWLLWPEDNQANPSTTTVLATEPTTPPPSSAPPTIAPEQSTSTTLQSDHIVDTVEEAEAILRELWFGWFEGIYNQDEERIREVVATEEAVEAASESFGLEFENAPRPAMISFSETEILRSDLECLAVWTVMSLSEFREGRSPSVQVLRWRDGGWVRLSQWAMPNDLWEADCESLLS